MGTHREGEGPAGLDSHMSGGGSPGSPPLTCSCAITIITMVMSALLLRPLGVDNDQLQSLE